MSEDADDADNIFQQDYHPIFDRYSGERCRKGSNAVFPAVLTINTLNETFPKGEIKINCHCIFYGILWFKGYLLQAKKVKIFNYQFFILQKRYYLVHFKLQLVCQHRASSQFIKYKELYWLNGNLISRTPVNFIFASSTEI